MLIYVFLSLSGPMIYKNIIDLLSNGRNDFQGLFFFVILYFVIINTSNLVDTFTGYLYNKTGALITFDIRRKLFEHLGNLPMTYFNKMNQGDLLTRLTTDIDQIQSFSTITFMNFLSSILKAVIIISLLVYLNPKLALICLIIIPITQYLVRILNRKISYYAEFENKHLAKLNSIFHETISNIYAIKVFSGVKKSVIRIIKPTRDYTKSKIKADLYLWMSSVTGQFLSTISAILILYLVGGYDVLNGKMTLGELVAFGNYLGWAIGPILTLSKITSQFARLKNSYERIQEVLNEEREEGLKNKLKITKFSQAIEIKNLSFDYGRNEKIIDNLSLTIPKGKVISFVGASGCGKSTLVNLILKIYQPKSGEILFDQQNIAEINNNSFRKIFGLVSQDIILFNDTIENNLLMFNPGANSEEILTACKIAQIDDFIQSLPDKYQTIIGENGVKLSGGQKQRLSIARAIVYNPEIFIFDEATSHLDSESEKLVQTALEKLMKEKTTIIIAHRLSTIVNSDIINVMDEGKIIEQGSHKQLLEKKGAYYELWEQGSSRYAPIEN